MTMTRHVVNCILLLALVTEFVTAQTNSSSTDLIANPVEYDGPLGSYFPDVTFMDVLGTNKEKCSMLGYYDDTVLLTSAAVDACFSRLGAEMTSLYLTGKVYDADTYYYDDTTTSCVVTCTTTKLSGGTRTVERKLSFILALAILVGAALSSFIV